MIRGTSFISIGIDDDAIFPL